MNMKGLIVKNAYFESSAVENQCRRLKEELTALGADCEVRKNDDFFFSVKDGRLDKGSFDYDFVIYLDKDKYVLSAIEKSGAPVFNDYRAITLCDDKALSFLALVDEGIPMPDTCFGLLLYDPNAKVSEKVYRTVEERFGYPFIIKECYGSRGEGVYLVDDRREFEIVQEKIKRLPHLYQRYVEESRGRDVRVIVVGGKVIGAMERRNSDDFRSNVASGGVGVPYEPDEKLIDLSEKIVRKLGLCYAGIDFLFSENGYLLSEVNSNAFFEHFEKVTGKNVAKAYAEYVVSTVDKTRKSK